MRQLLLSLWLAAGFVGSARAEAPIKLIYALPVTVPAAIPYVALDKGFFKDEGLDVEAKMFSSGREALQALLAKQAQIQSVSETPVVHALLQGNDLAIVATVAEHIEAKLIARKDRGIVKPGDLVGKRVATLPGTNSDYFMYRFLQKHGIALDQVRITNMPPPEMVVAYAKGDIDAYFAWEPHIYYGKARLPEESKVFYPGPLYHGRTTVNMDPDFVREHPEAVRKVMRAFLKAEAFIKKHPRESIALVADKLKMEPEALKAIWPENTFTVELDRTFLRELESIGRWARERTRSDRTLPDFRQYIHEQALSREKPSAVKL